MSSEFQSFVNAGNSIDGMSNLFVLVQKVGTWYYKQNIKKRSTKEEQLEAIYNSSEYTGYSKSNSHTLEKMDKTDVDALCNHVGYWDYMNRVFWNPQREASSMLFNSPIEIGLNKNQKT